MEQRAPSQPDNQNHNSPLEAAVPEIQNSALTQVRNLQQSGPSLKESKMDVCGPKKGQYVISYNFDHDNPTNNNSITHNIFIGWDDEPTKKKPIKKIKIHQTPSVIRTRTPVRNRITITNNVVSQQELKNQNDNQCVSINQLTKRIGNDIKDKYNSMFVAPVVRAKSKQSSLYQGKNVIKQEHMPLIDKKNGNEKQFISLSMKKNPTRNASCKMLKPIPNPILQTLRKSENQPKENQAQVLKNINQIIPQGNKQNNYRVKLASFPLHKDKNIKAKDELKNTQEKIQYRNGRTIQHNQLPKIPETKPVKIAKNQKDDGNHGSHQTSTKKSPLKQPKQKPKKIFNTADSKMHKEDSLSLEKDKKQEQSGQFSDYGADTLKLIQELQKMESEGSLNKSEAVLNLQKQSILEGQTQKSNNLIQKAEAKKISQKLQDSAKKQSRKVKKERLAQKANEKKKILNKNPEKQQKSVSIENRNKSQDKPSNLASKKKQAQGKKFNQAQIKQPKKDKINSEQSKQKQQLQEQKTVKPPKNMSQKEQNKQKKSSKIFIPKLSISENQPKQKQNAPVVDKQTQQKIIKQNSSYNNQSMELSRNIKCIESQNQNNPKQGNVESKQKQVSPPSQNLNQVNNKDKKLINSINSATKLQRKKQPDRKAKIHENKAKTETKNLPKNQVQKEEKTQAKKQLALGSPLSPRMYNAVYLQDEQQTLKRSVKKIPQQEKGKNQIANKQNQRNGQKNKVQPKHDQVQLNKNTANSTLSLEEKMKQTRKQNENLIKGSGVPRSPRQLQIKSNQFNMKITSRESKNQSSIPVTKKNEKDEAKSQKNNTNHNSSEIKKQQHRQNISGKDPQKQKFQDSTLKEKEIQNQNKKLKVQSQKSSRSTKQPNHTKIETNINKKQKLAEDKNENKLNTDRRYSSQGKTGPAKPSERKQKIQMMDSIKNQVENNRATEQIVDQKVEQVKQSKKPGENQTQVKKSNSSSAIHRKKLDLKLMNREEQEQGIKKQPSKISKNQENLENSAETHRPLKNEKQNIMKINLQQKKEPAIKQQITSRRSQKQKNTSQLLNKVQKNTVSRRQSLQGKKPLINKYEEKPINISSNRSSHMGKLSTNNQNVNNLKQRQKNRRSEYADSDSQLQTGPLNTNSQAPKLITCISKKSNQSESSIKSNLDSMQNRGDKKNKVPEPKLIKVKELKDASVQIEEMIKKDDRVQISVGASQKQLQEKTKRKSLKKKVMVDEQVQHTDIKNGQVNNITEEKGNVSVDDNIISFANITCEPNIQQMRKQSFLDIGNTDKLNRTDFIQVPKIIQRKFNSNNNSVLSQKNKAKDRSLFQRAPVLSFVYDDEKKLTQQQSTLAECSNNRLSTDACPLTNEIDTQQRYEQNCLIIKALKIVLEIDPWLIDRIIQPFLTVESENQIWLYCKGHWKCFRSNHLGIMSIFQDVIGKALRTQYNQTNPDALGIEELIRMITGFRVMQLKNKKKLSQQLSYHIGKGYTIKGISSKPNKPIYSITAVETTAKMDKLIKIQIKQKNNPTEQEEKDDNILWIKEEVFQKYFDYFLLICCREESWWTSKVLKTSDLSETLVYTIDSLTNSVGSLELHADCELGCKMDLYREVKPKILKFVGSVNEKNRPKRSYENPNPSLCFNFAIKGRYYIMIKFSQLPTQPSTIHLSLEASKQIGLRYLETIQHQTYKNSTSEYVEINKSREKTIGNINKSTIKHKEGSILGKDVGNIREQFINFLMEDANLQKNRN